MAIVLGMAIRIEVDGEGRRGVVVLEEPADSEQAIDAVMGLLVAAGWSVECLAIAARDWAGRSFRSLPEVDGVDFRDVACGPESCDESGLWGGLGEATGSRS